DVAAVSFTGSDRVGRGVAVALAGRGAAAQCEMGGQNASIVLADADIDAAAGMIAAAAMGYAGQKCTATGRVVCEAPAAPPAAGAARHPAELPRGGRYGRWTDAFSRDLARALELTRSLDTGLVRINQPTAGVDYHVPFGGEKDSGYGPREQGRAARDFYTSTR